MKDKGALSGSGLFLIELLFGLMIFALASAICLEIFVGSHQISNKSSEINHAVVRAQNGAECFKAAHGDLGETSALLKGYLLENGDTVYKYFDSDWNHVLGIQRNSDGIATNADYILKVTRLSQQAGYIDGEVVVVDVSGNLIFSLPVAAWEVTQ
jgi:hypothetical protein